jgi:hypothetical protein
MLDKKAGSHQDAVSAHPVLWICRRFSTVEPLFRVVLPFSLPFLHAYSDDTLPARPRSTFRMRRVRLVLSVDKTEVGQSLRWHRAALGLEVQPVCHSFFFLQTKAFA